MQVLLWQQGTAQPTRPPLGLLANPTHWDLSFQSKLTHGAPKSRDKQGGLLTSLQLRKCPKGVLDLVRAPHTKGHRPRKKAKKVRKVPHQPPAS